jgi:hypothetical protein
VRVRAERGAVSFVDLICRACGSQASGIATYVSDGSAPARIELGDLDEAAGGVVGVADVVDMGRFLTTFDGDFRSLFAAGDEGDTSDGPTGA